MKNMQAIYILFVYFLWRGENIMTKTDDFKFDQFNERHRAINKFFQELNNEETVVNFMIPLYHFALLEELKAEKYKDNQRAQELKNQLEMENINVGEIKKQIPELKIDGNKADTFDLLKKFVLQRACFYTYNTSSSVDSIIDYGMENLDKTIKLVGWMLFFGKSFIDQQIRFVYDYLASQSEKTINESDDKKLERTNKTVKVQNGEPQEENQVKNTSESNNKSGNIENKDQEKDKKEELKEEEIKGDKEKDKINENSVNKNLNEETVEAILSCLDGAGSKIKNQDIINIISQELEEKNDVAEQLKEIMDSQGNMLVKILDYENLDLELPAAMKFLRQKKIIPRSNRRRSQARESDDNELQNILKAASLLLTIKVGMGAEKFENTLKKGLNGELDWFGGDGYKQERVKKTGKKAKKGKKLSTYKNEPSLTFTLMVHNLVTGVNSNVRRGNLKKFFKNIEFGVDTIEKINKVVGIEEKRNVKQKNLDLGQIFEHFNLQGQDIENIEFSASFIKEANEILAKAKEEKKENEDDKEKNNKDNKEELNAENQVENTNKSKNRINNNNNERKKSDKIPKIENADTKVNWQSCLKKFLEFQDFVSLWRNGQFSNSDFLGDKNMINNKNLRWMQIQLINTVKQVDKIEYQSLYKVVDKINLSLDDEKFIYCNVIPNISEIMIHLNKSINSPQGNFYDNYVDNENTVQKKIYGLILWKDKKISFDDLEANFLAEIANTCGYSNEIDKLMKSVYGEQMDVYRLKFGLEAYSKHKMDTKDFISIFLDKNVGIGIKEKIDFASICNDAVEVLKNGSMITENMANNLTQEIKDAADISILGIIWQIIVDLFKGAVTEQKVDNRAWNDQGKTSPKISILEKLKQNRTISNLEKPLSKLLKSLNAEPHSDRNKD